MDVILYDGPLYADAYCFNPVLHHTDGWTDAPDEYDFSNIIFVPDVGTLY